MRNLSERQNAVNVPEQPPARTPAGDAFTNLISQVVRLIRLFSAEGEALAKPEGQTLARWLVLEAVAERPASVAEVARSLALARQSVQRIADLLEREGLAVYEDNPRHRRAKLLRLTPEGRQVLRAIQAAQQVWANSLGAEVGESGLRRASVVLDQVQRALTGRRPGRRAEAPDPHTAE